MLDDGAVRCWGYGNEGQLGYGVRTPVGDDETPGSLGAVDIGAGRTATAITGGGRHTCALLDDGSVRCWGSGAFGQLGYGTTASIGDDDHPSAAGPVSFGGHTATAVTAGLNHTCAILDDDSVRCWGIGGSGQLGYASTNAVLDPSLVGPVDLGLGRGARAITAGQGHTCAILDDGSVRCWGNGAGGRLGLCALEDVGDDELPGSVAPVDLGMGGAACPAVPPPPPPPPPPSSGTVALAPPPPPAPVTPPDPDAAAMRAEQARARGLRSCRSAVRRRQSSERDAATRRHRSGTRARARALRNASRRAARARARCLSRFARIPGRVTTLSARGAAGRSIVLTFRAAGSDGSAAPAARGYVVKQSRRPIRTRRDFERASALCGGTCTFAVTRVRATLTLRVTQLRRNTTYYYAIAARDNVSRRIGPRSRTVRARAR